MIERVLSLVTRANITLAIAILGAVGTVGGWIRTLMFNAKRLDIRLIKAFEPYRSIVMYIGFQNRSRLPISINSVSLVIGKNSYQCEMVPHVAFFKTKKAEIVSELRTVQFPVNLSPLSGSAGFVEFVLPPEDLKKLPTLLTLQASTNRGNLCETLLLPYEWDDVGQFL